MLNQVDIVEPMELLDVPLDINNPDHFEYMVRCCQRIVRIDFDHRKCPNYKDFHDLTKSAILDCDRKYSDFIVRVTIEARNRNTNSS